MLGKIEQFNSQQEEWPQCMERMEELFEVNDLTRDNKAAKRQPTFLAVIGLEPYELLRSLLAPMKPKEKIYAELVAKVNEHYSPTSSEIMQCMQRFRFNSRSRKARDHTPCYTYVHTDRNI